MDKKLIIQLAVLIAVLVLLLQPLGMGGVLPDLFPSGDDAGVNKTGQAVFNATIRTYDPFVYLPPETEQSVIDELNSLGGVETVRTEDQGTIVETETRDDVFPLAVQLRGMGADPLARANLAIPPVLEVEFNTGKKNVSSALTIMGVLTEPLVDAGTNVRVQMTAVVRNDYLIDYYDTGLLLDQKTIQVDALVSSLNYKEYTYIIPWEQRNNLENLSRYPGHEYERRDTITFSPPLDVNAIMVKKQFPYVEYIDAYGAQLSGDFDNLTRLESNFQDVGYSVPDSILVIRSNETPDIGFNGTVVYNYDLAFLEENYTFQDPVVAMDLEQEKELNSTVTLNMTVLSIGNNVISMEQVSPS
ncbi:hypothetical protein GF318_00440 [Candidatus Micrarchaeota archaeon]|nr:hypothetical protein [Candidatus Micrarchaeota archaeon]